MKSKLRINLKFYSILELFQSSKGEVKFKMGQGRVKKAKKKSSCHGPSNLLGHCSELA